MASSDVIINSSLIGCRDAMLSEKYIFSNVVLVASELPLHLLVLNCVSLCPLYWFFVERRCPFCCFVYCLWCERPIRLLAFVFCFFYSWHISCEVVFELQLKWADKGPKKSLFLDMVSQRYLALSLLVSIIERNRKHGRHPTDCLICGL